MYDPLIGQWISEDPMGFEAGDANVRRYVVNDSLSAVDPSGLEPWPVVRDPYDVIEGIRGSRFPSFPSAITFGFTSPVIRHPWTRRDLGAGRYGETRFAWTTDPDAICISQAGSTLYMPNVRVSIKSTMFLDVGRINRDRRLGKVDDNGRVLSLAGSYGHEQRHVKNFSDKASSELLDLSRSATPFSTKAAALNAARALKSDADRILSRLRDIEYSHGDPDGPSPLSDYDPIGPVPNPE